MSKRILVVGASGYIAARLIPELLERGNKVRCLARSPQKLARRDWIDQVEVVKADVTDPASLPAALECQQIVYYLVHSMSAGREYHQLDLASASNLANAAAEAGVEKIIYLGGLADREDEKLSKHMCSRIETGNALRQTGIPVIEFRSGVIIGTGSVSFEMIRALADQFPLMIGPLWLRHRTQPVATCDAIDRLVEAASIRKGVSLTVDLGCEQIYTYIDVMLEYAKARGKKRLSLLLPFIPPGLMAIMISYLTPVTYHYALPLVQGLKHDSLVQFPTPAEHFAKTDYLPYHKALEIALDETTLDKVDKNWLEMGKDNVIALFSGLAVHFHTRNVEGSFSHQDETHQWQLKWLGRGWTRLSEVDHPTLGHTIEFEHKQFGRLWARARKRTVGSIEKVERTIALRPNGLSGYLLFYVYRSLSFLH